MGFKVGQKTDGVPEGSHPLMSFFEFRVHEGRQAGNMPGRGVSLDNSVGTALIQYFHGYLQVLGGFLSRLGSPDGFQRGPDFVLFGRIAGGTALDAADVFYRRLDERHGTSRKGLKYPEKRRLIVNEPAGPVNNG